MAPVSTIDVSSSVQPIFAASTRSEAAGKKVSEVLQKNHDQHHIFFNSSGFHNHAVHHILTGYALGNGSDQVKYHYDRHASYQRPLPAVNKDILQRLADPAYYEQSLDTNDHSWYAVYCAFYKQQMEKTSWQQVLQNYLFSRSQAADKLFTRLFMGLFHPFIHLGFGVEFSQPAIIAEALAQAAVHSRWLDGWLDQVDTAAANTPSRSLCALVDAVSADPVLSKAASYSDAQKMRDGVMVRAPAEMLRHASAWQASPQHLDDAAAQLANAATYIVAGGLHPHKQPRFDFYFLHTTTSCIFTTLFARQDWLSAEDRARLLTAKGRFDLLSWAAQRAPTPSMELISEYQAAQGADASWDEVLARAATYPDDGHTSKLVRALASGEQVCAPFEGTADLRIKGGMWLRLANMVMDTAESGANWVYGAGFEETWQG